MRTEREALIDCLQKLNRVGIAYMLTGSMSSNYWGVPRTTHDIDFVIQFEQADVSKLVTEFESDFFIQESSVRAALRPPYQFNALDDHSALKVDFWTLRPDPFDCEMFARRVQVALFGEKAYVSSAEDIILAKLRWNQLNPSDRQLQDIAGVISSQQDQLNFDYLRKWAGHLNERALLEDLLAARIRVKDT
jgi:hypothetical protein